MNTSIFASLSKTRNDDEDQPSFSEQLNDIAVESNEYYNSLPEPQKTFSLLEAAMISAAYMGQFNITFPIDVEWVEKTTKALIISGLTVETLDRNDKQHTLLINWKK